VRDVDAPPFAADFFIMNLRIVDAVDSPHFGNAQAANGSNDRVGRDQNIALGRFQLHL
jgi:hypothetical protein